MTARMVVRGGDVWTEEGWKLDHDVVVDDGIIADIAPTAGPASGGSDIDASGSLVVPGLVDVHTHIYWGATEMGIMPDDLALGSGVTTVVDAGSAGSRTYEGFHRWIVGGSQVRVLALLHLSRFGLAGSYAVGELSQPEFADPRGALDVIERYPGEVVGLKVRASRQCVGGSCLEIIRTARDVCARSGLPLMIHIGETVEPFSEIVPLLESGDIVTHFQTPKAHGLLDEDGAALRAAVEARSRGVLFDSGHGGSHFSFDVAERLLAEGFGPDLISTDATRAIQRDLGSGLITVLNKWLAIGLPLDEALAAVTSTAARSVGHGADAGVLARGREADLAILRWEESTHPLGDAVGGHRTPNQVLRVDATIRRGALAWSPPRERRAD